MGLRLTLDVNQRVPEVSSDHVRRVNAIDQTGRGVGRGVDVGSVDRVDLRGDDSHQRVDESNGHLSTTHQEKHLQKVSKEDKLTVSTPCSK